MAKEQDKSASVALPVLKWRTPKGESGTDLLGDHRGNKFNPHSPEEVASALQEHQKAGNEVAVGYIHNGAYVGGSLSAKKPAAKKPAAKPAEKPTAPKPAAPKPAAKKPAAKKPAAKPAAKPKGK
jgi:hypothetical protein